MTAVHGGFSAEQRAEAQEILWDHMPNWMFGCCNKCGRAVSPAGLCDADEVNQALLILADGTKDRALPGGLGT